MSRGASLNQEPITEPAPGRVRDSCWPNELEFLLLQAGLLDLPKALVAWEKFCVLSPDIEILDGGCYRLFPLVAANLQAATMPVPHANRIRGVLRHAWANNQKLLGAFLPRLRILQDAGIDFLFLKGAALAGFYREKGGVRPMDDIDILIRPHNLPRALTLLAQGGCHPPTPLTRGQLADLLRFRHELTVSTESGSTLDIHWYLLSESLDFSPEDRLWEGSVPCRVSGLNGRTLNTSDHLLHACLHGAQWNEVSPVRWLADATVLFRVGVDWSRVEEQARLLRQVAPVRETVMYLNRLGIEIPPALVARWREVSLTPIENLEQGFRSRRPTPPERTRQLVWVYLRMTRHLSVGAMLAQLPAFMRQIHHFRSYGRRAKFLGYLLLLLFQGKRRAL